MSKRGRQECLPSCAESLGTIETAPQLLERILKERRRKWEEDQLAAYEKADKKPPANWKERYKEPAYMTPDLPALPEGWCWAKSFNCSAPCELVLQSVGAEAGYTDPADKCGSPRMSFLEVGFLDTIDGNVDDYFIHDGDLLFTRSTAESNCGSSCHVSGEVPGACFIQYAGSIFRPRSVFMHDFALNVGLSRKNGWKIATITVNIAHLGPAVPEMPIRFRRWRSRRDHRRSGRIFSHRRRNGHQHRPFAFLSPSPKHPQAGLRGQARPPRPKRRTGERAAGTPRREADLSTKQAKTGKMVRRIPGCPAENGYNWARNGGPNQ